ncbi:class F sortase [Streptomyces sp. ITFR-6]|uniref:class F sortase n=1 Tax=Streptomyces sp. ITFR-6 TaxID=3075197 RepID=UPI00288A5426|nr:class F sortase [Streptomyces sp. ITFR-6]WNI27515.1 class F sortase [Streptomyces sp. ITFR-6]
MNGTPDEGAHRTRVRRRDVTLIALAAALLLVGGLLLALGTSRQQPAPPPAADKGGSVAATEQSPATRQGAESAPPSGKPRTAALPASRPVSITIPSLKVTSTLEELGLGKDRAMETPRDPDKAGWYRPGATPGAVGPAVIAGHVTWNGAPGVFFGLGKLGPGDRISVRRADGRTADFTVDRTALYPKDRFPTAEVYRNLDHAGLRLITCGGDYSKDDSRYADNVVVYATLTGSHGHG